MIVLLFSIFVQCYYEVNLKAELEIPGLHEKMDEQREQKWTELILLQQEQIGLLSRILQERGIISADNPASDA